MKERCGRQLIEFMFQSWTDLDQAVDGITYEAAMTSVGGSATIAWSAGHVTQMLDSWLNVRFQGLPPHSVVGDPVFSIGATGDAADWPRILGAIEEVRLTARRFLDSDLGQDMDRIVPYEGSIGWLRPIGLQLRYAVLRIAAHHFVHAGEIHAIRTQLGHPVADEPNWGRGFV